MRIFLNVNEAMNEIKRDLFEMGVKVHPASMQNKDVRNDDSYDTLETQNYSFCILDMSDKDSKAPSVAWCKAEFAERIDPNFINPGTAWKLRPEVWTEFMRPLKELGHDESYKGDKRFWDRISADMDDDEKVFEYTYNERMQWQIPGIITELTENPDSRQAIILVHNREVDAARMRKFRIPCSISYQFLIRHGKLDIIYYLRSSDYATHLAHDLWLADELRKHIAEKVGVPSGRLFCNLGSLHVYKRYGGNFEHVF